MGEENIPRIFVVDDMEVNLKIVNHALKDAGYELYSFKDPREALEKMDEVKPHLFLLDVEMPYFTGIEMAAKIRSSYLYSDVPIIFITTMDDEKTMRKAFEAGATDFLNKPFKHLELCLRVKSVLKTFFLSREIRRSNVELEIKADEISSLNHILVHDLAAHAQKLQFYASLIEKGKLDISKYRKSVGMVLEIISHVREMLALEGGKRELVLTKVSVLKVAIEAIENIIELAEKKNINIIVEEETLADHFVIAHEKSLKNHVITNILSNAIKYSFSGSDIIISGRSEADSYLLEIRDSGTGIPQEILDNLFNKYSKTSTVGTDNEKGTGFGMPLVKTYMDHYKGRIEVDTNYSPLANSESGTSFRLRFSK